MKKSFWIVSIGSSPGNMDFMVECKILSNLPKTDCNSFGVVIDKSIKQLVRSKFASLNCRSTEVVGLFR